MARRKGPPQPRLKLDVQSLLVGASTSNSAEGLKTQSVDAAEDRDQLDAAQRALYDTPKKFSFERGSYWVGLIALIFMAIAALVSFAVQFTDLSANVRSMGDDVKDLKRKSEDVQSKLSDHSTKLQLIEREQARLSSPASKKQ